MSFKNDYAFGKEKEKEILNIINKKFNDNIKLVDEPYCKFDFEGDKYIYELKSRNCKYLSYPTTLLPFNKVIVNSKKSIFLFNFMDGLYYIRFREKIFKTFTVQSFCRKKRNDFNDKVQLYYYIPIEALKKIE